MFLKWIGLGIFFVLYLAYDACFVAPDRNARQQAQVQWDRDHYTGWRLEASYDTAHGLYDDKLTKQTCSTIGYPGYPACPAQQYYSNGRPASQVPNR